MRIRNLHCCIYLLLVICSEKSYCQTKENTPSLSHPLPISIKDKTIEEVLKGIEDASGLIFVYDTDLLYSAGISLNQNENVSLKDFLDKLFSDKNLGYEVKGNLIVITPKVGPRKPTQLQGTGPPPTNIEKGKITTVKSTPGNRKKRKKPLAKNKKASQRSILVPKRKTTGTAPLTKTANTTKNNNHLVTALQHTTNEQIPNQIAPIPYQPKNKVDNNWELTINTPPTLIKDVHTQPKQTKYRHKRNIWPNKKSGLKANYFYSISPYFGYSSPNQVNAFGARYNNTEKKDSIHLIDLKHDNSYLGGCLINLHIKKALISTGLEFNTQKYEILEDISYYYTKTIETTEYIDTYFIIDSAINLSYLGDKKFVTISNDTVYFHSPVTRSKKESHSNSKSTKKTVSQNWLTIPISLGYSFDISNRFSLDGYLGLRLGILLKPAGTEGLDPKKQRLDYSLRTTFNYKVSRRLVVYSGYEFSQSIGKTIYSKNDILTSSKLNRNGAVFGSRFYF